MEYFTMRETVVNESPRTKFRDGQTYTVTDQNRKIVEALIRDGKAVRGDPRTASMSAPAAKITGRATVK